MLEIKFLRENPDIVKAGLRKRNYDDDALSIVDEAIAIDTDRRQSQTTLDKLLSVSNQSAKLIGNLYREGKRDEADQLKQEVASAKSKIKELEAHLTKVEADLENVMLSIPNVPNELVPFGKGEEDNEVFQDWPHLLPDMGEGALAHWDLAKKYNIIDFGLGAKISGSGFALFRGKGAKLERALINFFLEEAEKAGYEEIIPPLLVNEASARGTG
ncbi:MAG TPA: serine--tRNA ligase, partial [Saprospiraceae bacterium]|nr:serine--tRNA ligase [Saprospiraceae bacterium]